VIPYEKKMPLTEELKYFAEYTNGEPIKIADAQNGVEVLEILEKASESLLTGTAALTPNPLILNPSSAPNASPLTPDVHVHESVVIDEGSEIGSGTKIWHFSHILSGSHIGEHCNVGQNVVIGPKVSIGNNCKIQNNVCIYEGVTLEDGVFCGPSMVFTNVYNPRAEIRKMDQLRPILVKKGATIGANATIICGITLGRYCFIGAGAVITKDVPDHALMVGNPGKQIGWVCKCGESLTDDLTCTVCGNKYKKVESGLK
jgi:UDP-2-acetamido-3-amino-2,3-dideoxy-glucuronate N-acetyltransferase